MVGDSRPAAAEEAPSPARPRSRTRTFRLTRASSRARAQPITPAPITRMSGVSMQGLSGQTRAMANEKCKISARRAAKRSPSFRRPRLQQLGHGPLEQLFALRPGQGHRRLVAALEIRRGRGDVAGAAVAVAGHAHELVLPQRLGLELVL